MRGEEDKGKSKFYSIFFSVTLIVRYGRHLQKNQVLRDKQRMPDFLMNLSSSSRDRNDHRSRIRNCTDSTTYKSI